MATAEWTKQHKWLLQQFNGHRRVASTAITKTDRPTQYTTFIKSMALPLDTIDARLCSNLSLLSLHSRLHINSIVLKHFVMPTSDASDPIAKYCCACVFPSSSSSSHFSILVPFLISIDFNFTHLWFGCQRYNNCLENTWINWNASRNPLQFSYSKPSSSQIHPISPTFTLLLSIKL